METYDWDWVQEQVDRSVDVWNGGAGEPTPGVRRYKPDEQQIKEEAYDRALLEVEQALRSPERNGARDRILASFSRFSSAALGLDREATELLTEGFMPIGTSLAQWARQFDPELSMAGIIQAARNAWTACGLQPLFGVPLALTPSILGYSLIYPYSDNLLDDEDISIDAKLCFSRRLRIRLTGEQPEAEDQRESKVWALIAMIEKQYPRELFPGVYESLLAIHRAQEASVGQIEDGHSYTDTGCLRVSCAKGGSSVLADGCLAYGSLTAQESQFAFDWGVLLQLGDDLQDVQEDLRRQSMTLFSRAAAERRPLDDLTIRLLRFSEHVGRRMEELPAGTRVFKDLLKMSWKSLITAAVADSSEFFSADFVREAELTSPFRFEFLRARKARLANRRGLYSRLFEALLESDRPGTRATVLVNR